VEKFPSFRPMLATKPRRRLRLETMSEPKKRTGGCHCGAVSYEVTASFEEAMECNCTFCSKAGALLGFVPVSQFKLLSGADKVTDYQFNKKHLHHTFCSTCGVRSYSTGADPKGNEMVAINLRCLQDFDAGVLPVKYHNGRVT
jgi:hypothetical protein